jgi:heavy metal translocating P-type ATPase
MTFCSHCGLPVAGRHENGQEVFCCYGCRLASRIVGGGEASSHRWHTLRMGLGAFLAMDIMMVAVLLYTGSVEAWAVTYFRWAMCAMSAPAIAILDYPFIVGSLAEIRRKHLSLDTLIALGSLTAFGVSAFNTVRGAGEVFFDTATMLPALVTFGKLIEASAKSRAAAMVRSLESLLPTTATKLMPAGPQCVPCDQLQVGDRIVVRDGERFSVDGTLADGSTIVQESAFTGEWQPRQVGPGDAVFAGTINGADSVTVQATCVGKEMLLWRILQMVHEAHAGEPRWERLGQRIAAAFIPAVCLAAAAAGAFWWVSDGPSRGAMVALAVMVVACPCAMGIAAPLVTALAVAQAARSGVVVRGGAVLERLGQVRRVFWDKTGTITMGNPTVVAVEPLVATGIGALEIDDQKESATELLRFLATLEATTSHCLGQAIVRAAKDKGLALGEATDVHNHPGLGISGQVTCRQVTRQVAAGSREFVREMLSIEDSSPNVGAAGPTSLTITDNPQSARSSPAVAGNPQSSSIYVAWDGHLAGRVILTDKPRDDAAQAVRQLAQMGITSELLSGDSRDASTATACEVGIANVHAPRRPQEKIDLIKSAMGTRGVGPTGKIGNRQSAIGNPRAIAMVGDGINDAPALAQADIGVAVGGGTDLARQAGNVILLSNQLSQLPWLISLSRFGRKIIRQNLYWALAYNAIAIAAAATGRLHPLLAAAAMVVSSLTVLWNALRVRQFPRG